MSGLKPESNRVTIETFTYDIQAYKISSIELNVNILERYLFRQNQSYFRSTMPKRKYHSNASKDSSVTGPSNSFDLIHILFL